MKTLYFVLSFVLICYGICGQEVLEKNRKITRRIKKEEKKWLKEGYSTLAGEEELRKQLEKTFLSMQRKDEKGNELYFVSTQVACADNYLNALEKAWQYCQADIATQIGNILIGAMKANVYSIASLDDDNTVITTLSNYQQKLDYKKIPLQVLLKLRKIENKKTHLRLTAACLRKDALALIKEDLRKELKERANLTSEEINQILNIY